MVYVGSKRFMSGVHEGATDGNITVEKLLVKKWSDRTCSTEKAQCSNVSLGSIGDKLREL